MHDKVSLVLTSEKHLSFSVSLESADGVLRVGTRNYALSEG